MNRRNALASALVAASGAWLSPALAQQTYPDRPIHIVVPATPGSSIDNFVRFLAPRLTEAWGQPVVIDNKRGAGQSMGVEAAARSKPDGYTLLMASSAPFTINPVMGKVNYDPLRDLDPVIGIGGNSLLLVARSNLPIKKVADLIALARRKPKALNAGSSGNGSTSHLSVVEFNRLAGVELLHVPYRGGPQSLNAAVAGDIDIVFSDPASALPMVKEGRLQMLAVTGPKRLSFLPDVPTLAELGVAGFNVESWFGIFAPHGTPPEIVRKIHAEIARQLQDPQFQKYMVEIGMEARSSTPEQLGEMLKRDIPRWRDIVSRAGLKAD